jgi:hypothetical protein
MIVFDDEGESWHASSLALKRELSSSIGGTALAEYSVVNIGFVAGEQIGGAVRVRVRPAVASGAALAGMLYWVFSQSVERVVVSYFEEKKMTWSHALVGSRDAAVELLGHLLAVRSTGLRS